MGAITEVSIEYSRTENLGNFKSERLQVGFAQAVSPGDDPEALVVELAGRAKEIVEARLLYAEQQRRLERQQAMYGRSARPRVDECDGEEDDPERPF